MIRERCSGGKRRGGGLHQAEAYLASSTRVLLAVEVLYWLTPPVGKFTPEMGQWHSK